MKEDRKRVFRDAHEDIESSQTAPDTVQTRAPAYRLAFDDPDFLCRDELRPVRLQLELLKPELLQSEAGIETTIVLFGGARIPPPVAKDTARTETLAALSRYYDEARTFARIMTEHVTPELCFNFHYFGIRKMHFLMRARAVAVFPGGFGTLDELFETLTLVQTGRMERVPILLFGRDFWTRIIDWDALSDAGTISPEDLELFAFVETAEEAIERIDTWADAGVKRTSIPGRL